MASATKNIVAELNKGDKLNGDNYDIWHRKVQYILEELQVLETLHHTMTEPPSGTTGQHKLDSEAYQTWKRINNMARITLLSSMQDDIMCAFERHKTAKEMWEALKEKFGGTSTTKLRKLTIKFDTYKKRSNVSMKQHLREMSNMIRELKSAGHTLTDEQQVQAVIRSLPKSWEHMAVHMTHNDSVKTFEDITRHLELEEERLEAAKPNDQAYVTGSSSHGVRNKKRKRPRSAKGKDVVEAQKGKKTNQRKRGRRGGQKGKDKAKVKCFACGKLGHFARECTEQKTQEQPST